MSLMELSRTLDVAGFALLHGLIAFLWQSSLFLSAVTVIALLLRRKRAAIRHRLWVGALLALPLLPLLGGIYGLLSAPRAELAILPAYTAPISSAVSPAGTMPGASHAAPESGPVPEPQGASRAPAIFTFPWVLFLGGYTLASLVSLALLGLGWTRLRRWRRTGSAVDDPRTLALFGRAEKTLGLSWRFRLVECAGLPAPLTLGFFRPVILLPKRLASRLTDEGLHAVAAHELAHMRRGDPLTLGVVSFLRAVFFFHPMVWYAARQVSDLAEQACDDRVLETGCEPVEYAALLARIAESLRKPSFTTELAAGFVFSRHAFLRRVQAILSHSGARFSRLSRLSLAGVFVLAAVALTVALALPLGGQGKRSPATWKAFLKDISNEAAFRAHLKAIGMDTEAIPEGRPSGVYIARRQGNDPLYVVECSINTEYPRSWPPKGVLYVFGNDGSPIRNLYQESIEKGVIGTGRAGIMRKIENRELLDLPDIDGDGFAELPVQRWSDSQQPEGTFILYSTRSKKLPVIFAVDIFRRWPLRLMYFERGGAPSELLLKMSNFVEDEARYELSRGLRGFKSRSQLHLDDSIPPQVMGTFRWSAEKGAFIGPQYGPAGLWEALAPSRVMESREIPRHKKALPGWGWLPWKRGAGVIKPPTMELVVRRSRTILPEQGVGGEDSLTLLDFKQRYSLKEGEDVKYIGQPFPLSRKVYCRLCDPQFPDGSPCLVFLYGEQLKPVWRYGIGLGNFLVQFLNLKSQDVVGDREILLKQIKGDLIIREGLPPERLAALLGPILTRDLNIPLSLTFREVPRDVVVVKGAWRFTPFPDGPPMVEAFSGKPESLREGSVREDSLGAFISWIGDASGRSVIDEITSPHSIPVTWHWNTHNRQYIERPEAVLLRISLQTGLSFTMEKRRVRVLEVK